MARGRAVVGAARRRDIDPHEGGGGLMAYRMTTAQRRAMRLVYQRFHASGSWPLLGDIDHEEFVRTGKPLDLAALMVGIPNQLANHDGPRDGRVWLRLRGIRAAIGLGTEELDDVARVVELCVEMYRRDRHARLRRANVIAASITAERAARFHQLVRFESYLFGSGSGDETSEWEMEILSSIAHFEGARSIDEIFARQRRVERLEIRTFRFARERTTHGIVSLHGAATPIETEWLAESVDLELWQEVAHLVEAQQWGQVASQSAIYFESRLRSWLEATRADGLTRLVALAFKEGGRYPVGASKGERQGWFDLALGVVLALRNVDAHGNKPTRGDARRYAIGVLGTVSLLLTQLKECYPQLAPSRMHRRRNASTA
jgi:hypothetical protein